MWHSGQFTDPKGVEALREPALLSEPILTEIVTRLFDSLLPPLES